jgi:hypothetical protein
MAVKARAGLSTDWSSAKESGAAGRMSDQNVIAGDDPLIRDLTRSALRAYMRMHRIGVPALKARIEDADPKRRTLPLSSLQRFIAATHVTSAHHVALCYEFARELPYYGKDAEIVQTGVALAAFLSGPSAEPDLADVEAQLHELIAGEYGVYRDSRSEFPLGFLRAKSDAPVSSLTMRAIPGARYFEVSERFDTPGDQPGSATRETYEGVAVINGIQVHFLMRDSLSHMPRMLSLTVTSLYIDEHAPVVMTGESFQHDLRSRQPANSTIRIMRMMNSGAEA